MNSNSIEAGTEPTVTTVKPLRSAAFQKIKEEGDLLLQKMKLRRERVQALEEEYFDELQKQKAREREAQPCIKTLQGGKKPLWAIKAVQLLEKMEGKR